MNSTQTAFTLECAEGHTLAAVLHEPENPASFRPWVIISHGMLSSKEGTKQPLLAKALADDGFYALRFDYRGQGESGGSPSRITFSGNSRDLTLACKAMLNRGASSLVLLGSSMGAATSALVAAAHPDWVRACVFLSTMVHADLFARIVPEDELTAWRDHGTKPSSFPREIDYEQIEDARLHNIPAALASLPQPKLFLHGSQDALIPPAMLREVYEPCREPKLLEIIEGADHPFSDGEHRDLLVERVVDWLRLTVR